MLLFRSRLQLIGSAALMVACYGLPAVARAGVVSIGFTAVIGSGGDIDTDNLFGQGAGANLAGQTVSGLVTINAADLMQKCVSSLCVGAAYEDEKGGAVTVSYSIRGVTQTVTSAAPFWGIPGGLVGLESTTNGGWNYLSVLALSSGGTLEESLGALFNNATTFSVYGGQTAANANAESAINSLSAIGDGAGLVVGGITLMTGDGKESLVATINSLDVSGAHTTVPEPATLAVLGSALSGLGFARRKTRARRTRNQD